MGRRVNQLAQQQGGAPSDVVTACNAYTQRLKEKPLRMKLHVSSGKLADGHICVEDSEGGIEQIVVHAHVSAVFGLGKREIRHVFKVGELERSTSTHTASLTRSIKSISNRDETLKNDLLSRSLSLVHKHHAVDITLASKGDCDNLGEWIDAMWSVSKIQKSFKGNPRVALALMGKNKTMDEKGMYDALYAPEDTHGGREGESEVDASGFGRLPKLDRATKTKLQDDLLNGVHVTYHDLSLGGYISTSSARLLRYDCESKEGLVYLEASFVGDGDTIVEPIANLVQVGGGPSAHGPTSSLLRATGGNKLQRASAVSLVFKGRSMDITCGSETDARELVLYFSEVKGFTRAKPPDRSTPLLPLSPARAEADRLEATAAEAHSVGKAMLDMASEAGGRIDVEDAVRRSAHHAFYKKEKKGRDEASFSTRFQSGYDKPPTTGDKPQLDKQRSAASGFNSSPSVRDISAALRSPGGDIVRQRVWSTQPGTKWKLDAGSAVAGASQFHSTPGPSRRQAIGGAPSPVGHNASGGGAGGRNREGEAQKRGGWEQSQQQEQQQQQQQQQQLRSHGHLRGTNETPRPTSPARKPFASSGGGGVTAEGQRGAYGFSSIVWDEGVAQQQPRPGRTVGQLPGWKEARAPMAPTDSTSVNLRQRSPTSRGTAKDEAGWRGTVSTTADGAVLPRSPARGTAADTPPPPMPPRNGHDSSDRRPHRSNIHAHFPAGPRDPPAAAAAASATTNPGQGKDGHAVPARQGLTPPTQPRHPASLSRAAGTAAAPHDAENEAGVIKARTGARTGARPAGERGKSGGRKTTVERRTIGGIEHIVVNKRDGGGGGGGDRSRSPAGGRSRSPAATRSAAPLEDDESLDTFRVKLPAASPTSGGADRSGSGSGSNTRRSWTAGMDDTEQHSSSPTKVRLKLRTTGIGKAIRDGTKILTSGGGASPKNVGPLSTSLSPAREGSSEQRRGRGSGDVTGTRNRFFSNRGRSPVDGVEDFTSVDDYDRKFKSSPGVAATPALSSLPWMADASRGRR